MRCIVWLGALGPAAAPPAPRPPPGGRSPGCPCCETGGTPTGRPQPLQNRLPSGLSAPHAAHRRLTGVFGSAPPHPAQNLLPGGFPA